MRVSVRSEIGRLRTALVHEPGPEVDLMVPAMMEQLLFDDILYGDRAREEFARFRRVMQHVGVEVLDAAELLVDTLAREEARRWIVEVALAELYPSTRRRLLDLDPEPLAAALAAGLPGAREAGAIAVDDLFELAPIPNWCFQRDPQIVLGDGVVFCSMAAPARHREAMLARAIFRFHPMLSATPVVCDPIEAEGARALFVGSEVPHLEGGDVLVLSDDVVAVGLSERTNRFGIRQLARGLSRGEPGPRWLVVVQIPHRRAYMHLDTLITPVDREACLIYPPVILDGGGEQAQVFEIDLRSRELALEPAASLLAALERRGVGLEPIRCGGGDPLAQQREQWTDGANALALAPGVVTLYDRNVATAEELARHGFRVVAAEDLLLGREEIDLDDCGRVCVLISSHEISRARGGPHCLVHPLARDAPP